MKKNLVLFITALFITSAFCQTYQYVPFPDSGAIWSEVYLPPLGNDGYPPPVYERFAVNGEDTIIDNKSYTKLFLFYDSVFNKSNANCIGGIREDENKQIYYKSNSYVHEFKPMNDLFGFEEIVLYNFSVDVHDTIKKGNFVPGEPNRYLIVTNIDTIQIGNTLRKIISFQHTWVKWIEGIGSVKGLLFNSGALPTNGIDGDLICFLNNDTVYYENIFTQYTFPSCFPILTNINKNNNNNIKAYPNPNNNSEITFAFPKVMVISLEVFDFEGRSYGLFEIGDMSLLVLSTEKYQPGIYFYKATDINGKLHTGKFVVQ